MRIQPQWLTGSAPLRSVEVWWIGNSRLFVKTRNGDAQHLIVKFSCCSRWTGEILFPGTSGCKITRWTLFIRPGSFAQIHSRQRTVPPANWHGDHDRPIFFFELRDRYVCGWCELHGSQLILVPTAQSHGHTRHVRYPGDATIVGRVTAVAMRIAEARDSLIKGSPLT